MVNLCSLSWGPTCSDEPVLDVVVDMAGYHSKSGAAEVAEADRHELTTPTSEKFEADDEAASPDDR